MQAWLEDLAPFVKSIDPNHLLSGGGSGSFGASTPDRFNVRFRGSGLDTELDARADM